MASRMDFSNKKVGNAFIVKSIHVANKKKLFWLCKCDCGNEFLSTSYQLSHNKTIACIDCINKDKVMTNVTKMFEVNVMGNDRIGKQETYSFQFRILGKASS